MISQIGPVIGTHVGPGLLGAGAIPGSVVQRSWRRWLTKPPRILRQTSRTERVRSFAIAGTLIAGSSDSGPDAIGVSEWERATWTWVLS